MQLKNMTLAQLKGLEQHIPSIRGLVGLPLVESYEEFLEVLYSDLDYCNKLLVEHRQALQNDNEDRLSIQIVASLKFKGYIAEHDTQHGGHVDIFVKHNQFTWIGEAKIHSTYDYLMDGFLQLTTRYSAGVYNETSGGLFIYIRNRDAKAVVDTWKEHLSCALADKIEFIDCTCNPDCFFSSIRHPVSGKQYSIRHMPIALHFEPQDKSARTAKPKLPKD